LLAKVVCFKRPAGVGVANTPLVTEIAPFIKVYYSYDVTVELSMHLAMKTSLFSKNSAEEPAEEVQVTTDST
jgi:hypothetical protein